MAEASLRVGIIGGGFTGLTAAFELLKKGYRVTLIEKESDWGGLASSQEIIKGVFLEKFYHHWFTNDDDVIDLCRELNLTAKLKFLPSKTSIFYHGQFFPFDSPWALLGFSPLPFWDRIRFGLVSVYLKLINNNSKMEKETASTWIEKWYGAAAYKIVWAPLLKGKFADFFDRISLTWFWARIKKRTLKLIYPEGGFQIVVDGLLAKIKDKGGQLLSGATLEAVTANGRGGWQVIASGHRLEFDRLVVTSSLKTFLGIFPDLPSDYRQRLDSIKYINAQMLVLVLRKSLTDYYWTNINEAGFPFLALVEQTNLVGPQTYQNNHIVYLGNYLMDGDPRLTMNESQLLDLYLPYLRRINSEFSRDWLIDSRAWVGPFAQPIVDLEYKEKLPPFQVPGADNLFLATMAQVYPWDRGTNYAIKLAKDLVRQHF